MANAPLDADRRRTLALLGAAAMLASFATHAQGGMVEVTVPYPAGGINDVVTRQLRPLLQTALGKPVVVQNVPGAGGALGLQHLLARPHDGDSILFGTESDLLLVPLSNAAVRLDPQDLRLIGLVGTATMVLACGPQRIPGSLAALLQRGRRSPAPPELSCANIGTDSYLHLIARQFARASGVPLLHVPYKGIAPLVQDLSAGHVDLAFLPLAGPIGAMVDAGRLRVLGVAAAHEVGRLPGVPTIAAAAQLDSFQFSSWSGLVVPRNTPAEVADRLNAAMQVALGDAGFRARLAETGATVAETLTLAQAERFYQQAILNARRLLAA